MKSIILAGHSKEIIMFGDHVGLCWHMGEKLTIQKGEQSRTEIREWSRAGDPYIDFVQLRNYGDEEWYEDEDSSVDGGLSIERAKQVAEELLQAVAHAESLKT